jgi:hypothetical protein
VGDDFVGRALGAVLAGILAVTTGVGAPARSGDQPRTVHRQHSAGPRTPPHRDRLPLADKVEVPVGHGSLGRDVSWPNCPRGMGIPQRLTLGKPMPPPGARYVLIGLTNGPAFYPNPCLRDQVAYARAHRLWASAYAVVTYPTPSQLVAYGADGPSTQGGLAGRLWNTGWAQARRNVAHMRAAGLQPPTVWVDVEPVRPPAPWSPDVLANRAVLEGAIAAYRKAGLQVGVYSTPYLWRSVVGDVDYGFPEWRAAGPTSMRAALAVCAGADIQGGAPVIGQRSSVEEDFDVLCPGRPALQALRAHFTPY